MKRRKFLIALGVVPPLVLEACSDTTPKPKTPTIVTGKVIDENNMPVEGWEVMFYGSKFIGVTSVGTFQEQKMTDVNGMFTISVVVPQDTGNIHFGPLGFRSDDKLNRKNPDYIIFIEVAGKFIQRVKDEDYPIIGQTNIYNYQIKKK